VPEAATRIPVNHQLPESDFCFTGSQLSGIVDSGWKQITISKISNSDELRVKLYAGARSKHPAPNRSEVLRKCAGIRHSMPGSSEPR
jgi:hypothetical protein